MLAGGRRVVDSALFPLSLAAQVEEEDAHEHWVGGVGHFFVRNRGWVVVDSIVTCEQHHEGGLTAPSMGCSPPSLWWGWPRTC